MGAATPTQLSPTDATRVTLFARQRSGARPPRLARHSFGKLSSLLPKTVRALPLLLFVLGVAGCSWTDKHGTRYVAIIGFGLVAVTNQPGATVQDVRGVGLVVDDAVSFGLIQRHRVEIDPNRASNLVVSIDTTPFGLAVRNFDARDGNFSFLQFNTNNPSREP